MKPGASHTKAHQQVRQHKASGRPRRPQASISLTATQLRLFTDGPHFPLTPSLRHIRQLGEPPLEDETRQAPGLEKSLLFSAGQQVG